MTTGKCNAENDGKETNTATATATAASAANISPRHTLQEKGEQLAEPLGLQV